MKGSKHKIVNGQIFENAENYSKAVTDSTKNDDETVSNQSSSKSFQIDSNKKYCHSLEKTQIKCFQKKKQFIKNLFERLFSVKNSNKVSNFC